MRIQTNYFFLLLLCLLASCDSSKDDVSPIDESNSSSGSYWPYAIGNKWQLVNPLDGQDQYVYHIYKSISYEGKTYFQVEPIGLTQDVALTDGFREDNGVFTALHGATNQGGVSISAGTMKSIDTNLKIGETWTDELKLTISGAASGSIHHKNEGRIIEKLESATINGKTYKDVVKTYLKKTITNSISGTSFTLEYENWLAKGVGLIYEKTTYDGESIQYGLVNHTLK